MFIICPDGTLWIADIILNKLQHIQFDKNNIEILLEFDISIWGRAVMNACNNLIIVAEDQTRLKIINSTTGRITDFIYDVKPYVTSQVFPECIHVTSDHKVIVGLGRVDTNTALIVMLYNHEYILIRSLIYS